MLIGDPGLIDKAKKHIPATRGFDRVAEEHLEMYGER
jgi:hypothetical protein